MTAPPPTSRHSYHTNHHHHHQSTNSTSNQHDQRLASNPGTQSSSNSGASAAAAQTTSHSRHSNRNNHHHHHHHSSSASASSCSTAQPAPPRSTSRSRSRSSRKTYSSNIEADNRKHHSSSTDNSDLYSPREKEERHRLKKPSIDSSVVSRICELQDPIFNENDDDIPLPPADEEENSSNEIDSEVDHNQRKNSSPSNFEDKTSRNNKQQIIDSQSSMANNNLNFLPIQPDSDYSETSEMIYSEGYDLEGESAEDDQSNLKGANKARVNSDSESTLEKLINLDTRNLTKRQRYIFQTMPTRILLRKHLAKEAVWGEDKLSNYKIINKIGHGTYGLVYKATRLSDQCDYALKKVKCENEKEGFPIFVIREIKILHQLNHPNIVGLKDVIIDRSIANDNNNNNNNSGGGGGKEMAVFYLVFEYMQHDLMGFLEYCKKTQNNQKLEVDQICSLMMQLISGVAHCHQQGFMHRDIKCSNILLNEKGQIKLADFGLSRPYQKLMAISENGNNNNKIGVGNSKTSESNSKTIRGTKYPIETTRPYTNKVITLWYRPPELLLGAEHYTPAVDVWSLGCILGEMFMLNPVFREPTELDMLDNIFRLCGTPNAGNWPDVVKMPTFSAVSRWKQHRRILCEIYEDKIEMMPLDLLDKMLTLDPKCRISSIEAMQHPWIFSLDQSQVKPLNLPNNRNLNEMSCKTERKQSSLSHIANANRQSKS